MSLIDFKLDGYDYLTFVLLLLLVIAFFYVMVTLGGLPGKLAEKRKHPHADSVKLGGWIGLFTVFPWIHALIWAYHDSLTIDVRKFPKNPASGKREGVKDDGPNKLMVAPAAQDGPGLTGTQNPGETDKPGGAA